VLSWNIRALLRLLPVEDRQKSREVGLDVIYTLRWWLLGQLVPMVFLGVCIAWFTLLKDMC